MGTQKSNRRKLGWLAAGMLCLLSSSAWALDLDREIHRQNGDSAQILSTLGRSKGVNVKTSKDTDRKVQVQMIKAPKARRKG